MDFNLISYRHEYDTEYNLTPNTIPYSEWIN